ncbi:MAG: GAP family protein [Mycobacterium sp.]
MWTSILVLALALNFEPTRFALVPMLLSRRNPVAQLVAYTAGSFAVSLIFGLLILFVFRHNPLGTNASTGGWAQIAVGAVALIVALIMAARWTLVRRRETVGAPSQVDPEQTSGLDKVFVGARAILRKGGSPWFAGLLGMGVGLPSVDFLAVLVIIATSHKPPAEQTAALLIFLLIGGFVITAPLIGYLFAPAKTLQRIEQFAAWSRSRSQIEYAGVLAFVGVVLVTVGWIRL